MRPALLILFCCLLTESSNAADVFYWGECPDFDGQYVLSCGPNGEYSQYSVNIVGKIVEGDFERLIATIKENGRSGNLFPIPKIAISSPGGDVMEAMKIGRFLRNAMLNITVVEGAECFSACFLVVVGSTDRYLRAPIGIHRAYFAPEYFGTLSPVVAEDEFRKLDKFVRSYLYEMNVPEDVIAEMMATKSTTGTYLQPNEFRERIGQKSPAIEEWMIARCGELNDIEWAELRAIRYRMIRERILQESEDRGHLADEERGELAEVEDLAYQADHLPAEYREALDKKARNMAKCKNFAERDHHEDILQAIIVGHSTEQSPEHNQK